MIIDCIKFNKKIQIFIKQTNKQTENLTIIKKMFINNSYKESFVDSLLKKRLVSINFSRLFYKDLYFFINFNTINN